ncbi:tripartite tricarboxylate transporter TctB family protein [Pseudomonas putida]|uniref:tripartite tricarboxylate transporter TctB family protein n=1 Tax=Pseudomonas putida TaxID=303 RepID=UPI0018ABBEAB|nr:tripartite tricarboxylate transporter TctB family protein [Pseudomonas putida]MBF8670241.1 tripartite tricarboxylate transporter TctB family protein [Pseudomonas putida]MBF8713115.1 tripartite tricarboxylate transporter TctB family protein [Pseudomonas putida]
MSTNADTPLVTTRWVEIGLALFTAALGGIVMFASLAIGIGWDDAGPEAGYFPFYIGLLLSCASLGNLLLALLRRQAMNEAFVGRQAFRQVLAVFLPIAVYVTAMPFAGIYLASVLFIAWFMWRARKAGQNHGRLTIALVACGSALACYLIFAVWFKVPLEAGVLGDLASYLGGLRP